jgi:hypothetical protein
MSPRVSSLSRWVDWVRSDLTVEMKSGLLVSDRLSLSWPWGPRSRSSLKKTLTTCGVRKFQVDTMGDHLCTCTTHPVVKKSHNWVVDQLPALFLTTHTVKTEQVSKSRGRYCGDIDLTTNLTHTKDTVPLVLLDLGIVHDRFGSNCDFNLNEHLHYPNDIDRSLNETLCLQNMDRCRQRRKSRWTHHLHRFDLQTHSFTLCVQILC